MTLPHPYVDPFRTHHNPYYIFSMEYVQTSGGFRSAHHLCHILNELGYEAYVTANEPALGLRAPILTNEIWNRHRREGRHPIAVYNETTHGNPLEGDVVVRWILNSAGHMGDYIAFGDGDLCYYWEKAYANGISDFKLLRVPVINRTVFNKNNANDGERIEYCYYARKYLYYAGKDSIPKKLRESAVSLCQDIKRTPTEIADILRRSKILFCYEPSAIAAEATLCGCQPVFIKTSYLDEFIAEDASIFEPLISEDDIFEDDNNFNTINLKIINNVEIIEKNYHERYEIEMFEQIKVFVKETQSAAKAFTKTTESMKKDNLFIFCESFDHLYIYGANNIAKNCCQVLKIHDIHFDGFVISDDVNDVSTLNKNLYGYPVLRLSDVKNRNCSCGFVIAVPMAYHSDIISNLHAKNFNNYIIYPLTFLNS